MTATRPKPFNYERPDWAPLLRAIHAADLPEREASAWMWMHEWEPGQHSYKHRDTRAYAHLTAYMDLDEAAAAVRKARGDA